MADPDTDSSPGLFADLDNNFDLGGDSSLDPTTAAATVASSTVGDIGPPTTTAAGQSGTTSASPSHQEFFNPNSANWVFQDTPPFDPVAGDNPFATIPQLPPQTWDLPVHINSGQPLLQQQQSPLYLQSPAASSIDPTTFESVGAPDPANISGPHAFFPNNNQQFQLQTANNDLNNNNYRNIQNTLTPAQQERLKSIAMPPHLQYHSPNSAGSPDSNHSHLSGPETRKGASPDPGDLSKPNSRKRKSSAEVDEDDDDDDEHPVKKTAHNMIEKRYRTNLNDKIAALRDSVPSLRIMSKSARGEDTTEDREELHGLTPAHKLNKATVLSKATEYIRHLEKRNNRLIDENHSMQARIAAFEKLFMAGAITGQMPNHLQQSPTPMSFSPDAAQYLNTPMGTPGPQDSSGMIPIPDDIKRIIASQQATAGRPYPVGPGQPFQQNPALFRQQQIQQQQQQAQTNRWSPYFGKLMVGSLAGLMLFEALVEDEKNADTTEGRGLMAVPTQLVTAFVRSTHFSIGGYYISAASMINRLKWFFVVGAFVLHLFPGLVDLSIFDKPQKPKHSVSAVRAVPSLASPIHVRRQAWLTAIQTVWVPRNSFFLEAAALLLKLVKYAARNVVGPHGYLMLTGLNEEQEAARVKAWSIALDAQLAGGDVEINKSRLTLTLIASGTLPDTPLRLMLKALHIRVLLWRLNGASWATNLIASKLARSRWNEARQLNRINNSLQGKNEQPEDALPEHLALLLEQDCDEVLNDDIIQRAHNLAWNKRTTHNVTEMIDGMDAVVEDAAVRSPMDAVAAWYSSLVLHRVLINSLPPKIKNVGADSVRITADAIDLATKIAPIGSNAQLRALVANAVLCEGKRGAAIATAVRALGPTQNPDKHPNYSKGLPPLIDSPVTVITPDPDAQMALRCAMGIAHLQKFADPPREAYVAISSILPDASNAEEGMSLLVYTAAFYLMEYLNRHPVGRENCSRSLERLAGTLRIWIGSSKTGDNVGFDGVMRQEMIDRCLAITKSAVGMEADPGYASMEDDCEDAEDGLGC
ncbi:hypothetical protein QBC38DRAFT_3588 [Podospora fimiseda]|uniref:BHLH domain-containing protein n=1 Tax=Podospora fimiseda TaxID=252190 RepID=A0AAN7C0X7_9PEZI|nr:hypothetical protein QBC38DRAFT_3588 [Podospora fimiseda]